MWRGLDGCAIAAAIRARKRGRYALRERIVHVTPEEPVASHHVVASIYIHDTPEALIIKVIGVPTAADLPSMKAAWITGTSISAGRAVLFDLTETVWLDDQVVMWISEVAAEGVGFITAGTGIDSRLAQVRGLTDSVLPAPRLGFLDRTKCVVERSFRSLRSSVRKCIACGCVVRKLWVSGQRNFRLGNWAR